MDSTAGKSSAAKNESGGSRTVRRSSGGMAPKSDSSTKPDLLEVPETAPLLASQSATRKRLRRGKMGSNVHTQVNTSQPVPPLISFGFILFLLFGRAKGNDNSCPCITVTRQGSREVHTLIYKTVYKCSGTTETCKFNSVSYQVCTEGSKKVCYDPKEDPERIWIEVRAGNKNGPLLTRGLRQDNQPISLTFDACKAISYGPDKCGGLNWERSYMLEHKYMGYSGNWWSGCEADDWYYVPYWSCVKWATWQTSDTTAKLEKGVGKSDCKSHECNPVNFIILKPQDWDSQGWWNKAFGILIDGKGSDPGVLLYIIQIKEGVVGEDKRMYQAFWKEIEADTWEQVLTPRTVNLFVELAHTIAVSMNVTNCYICGGTLRGDQWPWEVLEWNQTAPYNASKYPPHIILSRWELTNNLIGENCVQRTEHGINNPMILGDSNCKFVKIINGSQYGTWGNSTLENNSVNPWENLTRIVKTIWHNGTVLKKGSAPPGLYWICGKTAYSHLSPNWTGTCFLGHLRPSFFMIPLSKGVDLGQPVLIKKKKRELKIGTWKDDEWPPERIIAYYDPASWAQDGSYGYRTPIYLLNRLIRLQAVVELLTRENQQALLVLAKQNTKIKNAVYQNRLALDYLLAAEGGVCGKFNLTNCCLEIGDTQEIIAEITGRMKELAQVPVQTWTGMLDSTGWLGGIFNNWKQALFFFCFILLGLMIMPCVIPLIRNMISSAVQAAMPQATQMVIRSPEIQYKVIPMLNNTNE